MYGPEKYKFLKPTIEDNLKMASKYADSIKTSDRYNQGFIDLYWPDFSNSALLSYYHYKLYNLNFSRNSFKYIYVYLYNIK